MIPTALSACQTPRAQRRKYPSASPAERHAQGGVRDPPAKGAYGPLILPVGFSGGHTLPHRYVLPFPRPLDVRTRGRFRRSHYKRNYCCGQGGIPIGGPTSARRRTEGRNKREICELSVISPFSVDGAGDSPVKWRLKLHRLCGHFPVLGGSPNYGDQEAPPRRNTDVIRCENCGEEYSTTYKRCPFCDERPGGQGRAPVEGAGFPAAAGAAGPIPCRSPDW